jgi:hypothetical protein
MGVTPNHKKLVCFAHDIDERALRRFGKRFSLMDRKRLIWFSLRTRGIKMSNEIDRVRRERILNKEE